MKIMFAIAVGFSLLVCLIGFTMSMLGFGSPNLSGGETLLMFYLTLFGYTFMAFPLAGILIALITAISRLVENCISKI